MANNFLALQRRYSGLDDVLDLPDWLDADWQDSEMIGDIEELEE